MWKKRAEILVIECDATVGQTYPYRGKFPKGVSGRGGTEFNPAFEYLQKERKRKKFDGCIYLTDGFATVPTIKPPCKLLWVLTPDGTDENLAFGSNVKLN
jgi:predicted metal-dependent peptidase